MRAVGLKVLKNKLAEYVRLARDGEVILVTDRDRVVAELGPPRPERAGYVGDALLSEATRKGWIKAPVLPDAGPPPRLPVVDSETLLRELESDRGER